MYLAVRNGLQRGLGQFMAPGIITSGLFVRSYDLPYDIRLERHKFSVDRGRLLFLLRGELADLGRLLAAKAQHEAIQTANELARRCHFDAEISGPF